MAFDWQPGIKGTISIDNGTLETICYGPQPDQSPTLVLLHEGLGCCDLWKDFPEKLSKATGFGVFAYSRLGYGQSTICDLPRPLNFMSIEALEVLPQVLAKIGLKRAVLVGHSDGATISAIYAGSVSDHRIRGLVLIAPHFFTEEFALHSILEIKSQFERSGLRDRLAKYHLNVDAAFKGWNDTWLNEEFTTWDITNVIDFIRVPVLGIQGCDDQYGTAAQIDVLEERLYSPFERLMIKHCNHSPHLEKQSETLNAIVAFSKRLERNEAAGVFDKKRQTKGSTSRD